MSEALKWIIALIVGTNIFNMNAGADTFTLIKVAKNCTNFRITVKISPPFKVF